MVLTILSSKVSWFGKQSGYDVLTDYISPNNDVKIVQSGNSFVGKIIGKIFQQFFKWNWANTQDIFTELKFLFKINARQASHILHLESHVQIIEKAGKAKKNIIGTIHLPINQWHQDWLMSLRKYNHVIILYEKEIQNFSSYLPLDRIHFIRHGVNIDFFKPGLKQKINKNKVLIVGHYLRNFDMLFAVYNNISNGGQNDFEFHIVIPERYRNIDVLNKIKQNKNIFFHQNLSDQELLEQYQTSHLLLIPMNDSGANSAIVQALAVGLPVITTDVGGIRSYGGGDIYPIVENNNVDEMIALFKRYYNESGFRDTIASKSRKFAEEYLDWKIVANQHLDLYRTILKM